MADATLRTDRHLADFFKRVDQLEGLDNVWIALSADHGVAPTPAFILEHHLGPGRLDAKTVKQAVEQALAKAFGPGDWMAGAGKPPHQHPSCTVGGPTGRLVGPHHSGGLYADAIPKGSASEHSAGTQSGQQL